MAEHTHHRTFSISKALGFGWNIAKKNFWFFLAVLLIPNAISFLIAFIYQPLFDQNTLLLNILGFVIMIAGWIVSLQLSFATLALYFKFADAKKAELKDLFAYFDARLLRRYFLLNLLFGLMMTVGILLFIIPGIYLGLKYWFTPYIFVDNPKIGIIEAFKESARITKGVKWKLFLLGILQTLIMLAGVLALLVGSAIAVPINYLSDIYVYRKLSAKH